jgi:hypothetical protein
MSISLSSSLLFFSPSPVPIRAPTQPPPSSTPQGETVLELPGAARLLPATAARCWFPSARRYAWQPLAPAKGMAASTEIQVEWVGGGGGGPRWRLGAGGRSIRGGGDHVLSLGRPPRSCLWPNRGAAAAGSLPGQDPSRRLGGHDDADAQRRTIAPRGMAPPLPRRAARRRRRGAVVGRRRPSLPPVSSSAALPLLRCSGRRRPFSRLCRRPFPHLRLCPLSHLQRLRRPPPRRVVGDGARVRGPAATSARPGASRPNRTTPDLASPQPNATILLLLASPGAAQKTPKATSRSLCRPNTGTSADQGSQTRSRTGFRGSKKPVGKPVKPAGSLVLKNIGTVYEWEPDRFVYREPAEPVRFPTVSSTLVQTVS